jgi:two-component system response regulator RegA
LNLLLGVEQPPHWSCHLPADATEERTALVADDDELFRTRLGRALESRGWEVLLAANASDALSLARDHAPDLAVVDLRLGADNGLNLVRELRPLDATMFIVVLTGWGSIATAVEALQNGANQYLSKPADADQIVAVFNALPVAAPAGDSAAVPSLARVEWEHIQRVLTDCGGNISFAAKQLGLHRRTLQRKLSKYPPRQ